MKKNIKVLMAALVASCFITAEEHNRDRSEILFNDPTSIRFDASSRYIENSGERHWIYSENKIYTGSGNNRTWIKQSFVGEGLCAPEIVPGTHLEDNYLKLRVDKPHSSLTLVKDGDNYIPYSQRIEIEGGIQDFGRVRYLGFSLRVPSNVSLSNEKDLALIMQGWQIEYTHEDVEGESGPTLYMCYRYDGAKDSKQLQLRANNKQLGGARNEMATCDHDIEFDRWYDIVIGYRYSENPSDAGFVKFWIDGTKLLDKSGYLGANYTNKYFSEKIGLYRGDYYIDTPDGSLELHYKNIRRGTSYEEVAPELVVSKSERFLLLQ